MEPPPFVLLEELPVSAAVAGVTVTEAEADLVESAADTAVMVTIMEAELLMGAVYRPEVEIIPTVELPPAAPLTLQFTAIFEEPVTVAVNI